MKEGGDEELCRTKPEKMVNEMMRERDAPREVDQVSAMEMKLLTSEMNGMKLCQDDRKDEDIVMEAVKSFNKITFFSAPQGNG